MTATTLLSDNGVTSGITGYQLTGGNDGTLQLQTTTAGGAATTAVTINTSQNVGIGTASPTTMLQLSGSSAAGKDPTLTLNNTTASTGRNYQIISGDGGPFRIYDATAAAERMRIDTSGNVGIGTSSPAAKLDVFTGTNTNFLVGFGANLDNYYTAGGSGIHVFRNSLTERARIDSSGNLLVGATTSGYARFETTRADTGNVGVGRFLASAASGYTGEAVQIIATQAGGTGFNLLSCYYAGGAAYAFKVRGDGTIYAQNTTVQSASDARFKENIVDSTQGLDVVSALRPVRFDIKEGHGVSAKTNQLGFIAQEVKAVFPDAVDVWGESDDPENPYLSLGSTALIPVLTKAIQEQQALITTLTERITALEGAKP